MPIVHCVVVEAMNRVGRLLVPYLTMHALLFLRYVPEWAWVLYLAVLRLAYSAERNSNLFITSECDYMT